MGRSEGQPPDAAAAAGDDDVLPRFTPIRQLRAHEYVAEQLRRQIGLRLIRKGEALPPERELAALFGVGRATAQAAVRLLEADRLVETRRGRHGGTFVIAPSEEGLARDYLLSRLRRGVEECHQALAFRDIVEPSAAGLAATHRTARELEGMRAAADRAARAEDDAAFMAADSELHLAIAHASGNELLRRAVEQTRVALSDALSALPEGELWWGRSVEEHAHVLDAIERRDAPAAEAAMREHLASTATSIRALLRSL